MLAIPLCYRDRDAAIDLAGRMTSGLRPRDAGRGHFIASQSIEEPAFYEVKWHDFKRPRER